MRPAAKSIGVKGWGQGMSNAVHNARVTLLATALNTAWASRFIP